MEMPANSSCIASASGMGKKGLPVDSVCGSQYVLAVAMLEVLVK